MTADERVAKCLSQCVDSAREKVQEKRHLAMYLPLCLAVAKVGDSFPELHKPQGNN